MISSAREDPPGERVMEVERDTITGMTRRPLPGGRRKCFTDDSGA
jgi:hypothetical protein